LGDRAEGERGGFRAELVVADGVETGLAVAGALGGRLWGVRLDTSGTLVDRSLWNAMGTFKPTGVKYDVLRELAAAGGAERIIIALDSNGGRSVVKGWREATNFTAEDVIRPLEPFCSGFLCTYVDKEGMMQGTDLDWFRRLRGATGHELTAAGGITTEGTPITAQLHVHTVTAGAGYQSNGVDLHEFSIGANGNAFVTIYAPVHTNLTSVGGPSNGVVFDCIAQEINIKTNRVLWEWNALSHVPVYDSYAHYSAGQPRDYFNMNSIQHIPNDTALRTFRHMLPA